MPILEDLVEHVPVSSRNEADDVTVLTRLENHR
jgi:hypothetical protein